MVQVPAESAEKEYDFFGEEPIPSFRPEAFDFLDSEPIKQEKASFQPEEFDFLNDDSREQELNSNMVCQPLIITFLTRLILLFWMTIDLY